MLSYKKFFIIFLFASLLSFSLATFAIGACRNLEVQIPGLSTTCLPILPEYILAIFNFSLMAIGIVAFVALLYGGFRWLTSAGNPTAINDAKDQIFSALLGLIILFSSWLILNTINPELVILGEPNKEPIGGMPGGEEGGGVVTVYKDSNYKGDSCKITKSVSDIDAADACGGGWNDTISSFKINDSSYIVVLHEHNDFNGLAEVFQLVGDSELDGDINDKTSSITLIKRGPEVGKVTLYEGVDFGGASFDFSTPWPYLDGLKCCGNDFNDKASSIRVGEGAIGILFEHAQFKGCAILFDKDANNLGDQLLAPPCPGWCIIAICSINNWNDTVSSIYVIHGTIVR